MDPNNQPQQPTDSDVGAPPTPPAPGQQFSPQQPTPAQPSFAQPPVQPQVAPQQTPPVQPLSEPQPGLPATGGYPVGSPGDGPKNGKKGLIIALLVLVLVAAGIAGYFLFFKKEDSKSANKAAQNSSARSDTKDAIDMSTLQGAKLNLANPPAGYSDNLSQDDAYAIYAYENKENNNEVCRLILGISTPESLPGNSLDEIIKPQIEDFRKQGATVNGPDAGDALVLKDASSDATYLLPTLNFGFTYNGNQAVVHYSAAILKNGGRAIVNRTCTYAGESKNTDALKKLDEAAKKITVTKQ